MENTTATSSVEDPRQYQIRWGNLIPFFSVHALALAGIIYYGWSWTGFALTLGTFWTLMFGVTGVLHRYFSHRTYKTSRPFQFVLAFLATLTTQKGVLWWAAHHRHHHRFSDQPEDVHSPLQRGFFWSHVGWILVRKHDVVHWDRVKDLSRFPELVFLQKMEKWIVIAFATSTYFIAQALGYPGVFGLLWGYFLPTTLLWHSTFTINSFTHIFGRRRYKTPDDSRNSLILALLTMGEGWHNNHHFYQRSAAQGFYWWEIDITYYILKTLQAVGLVSGVSKPPVHVREAHRDMPEDKSYEPPVEAAPQAARRAA